MHGTTPAGWYPDPQRHAPLRWWDGLWWTAWQSDGTRTWSGTPPLAARRLDVRDLPALGLVRTVFVVEAHRRGVVTERQAEALAGLADQLAAEARVTAVSAVPEIPAPAAPTAPPTTLPDAAPVWTSTPVAAPAPVAPPLPGPGPIASPSAGPPPVPAPAQASRPAPGPREPSRLARWWAASRLRLDTDLTVHGLTYLGVLLLFVGVFGLVAFAFGDVSPGLRPVAELAVAGMPFLAAALLARSGARFVARAMVAVGGLILPVMVVTSTVDGFGFPPDLHGAALPVGAGLACALVAGAYVARVAARPDSVLGVMWAPVAWFAAGMAAVGLGRAVPRGEDVAVPGAAQVAVIALAVVVTTALAARARAPLAVGALAAGPAGVVVTAVLAVVAWFAEGWPVVPAVVTAVALTGAAAVLWPARADTLAMAGWLLVLLRVATPDAATPLISETVPVDGAALDARPVLLLAALLAGVGLLEVSGRRAGREPVPGAVAHGAVAYGVVAWVVALVAVGGALAGPDAWWAVAGAAVVGAWAAVRRAAPPQLAGASLPLDVLAGVAPLAAVAGVWQGADGTAAALVAAGLGLVTTPLARGRLRRGAADRFWPVWWGGVLGATVLGAAGLAADGRLDSATPADRAVVPVVLLLVAAALIAGPARAWVTVALVTPVLWAVWAAVGTAADLGTATVAVGLAALGLLAVVAARAPTRGGTANPATTAVALAVGGYATAALAALVSLAAPWPAWPFALALGAATLGWLLTAVAGDVGRSPVVAALDRVVLGGALAWVLALVGLPATAIAALHAGGVVRLGDPWWVAPLLVAALAYAGATRVPTPVRLRPTLPWTAFGFAVGAVAVGVPTAPDAWSAVAALGTLALVAPLARGRHPVPVWVSWAVLAPLAGTVAWNLSPDARALGAGVVAAGALVVVGGVLVVGALLAGHARPGEPRLVPRRAVARPPFALGATQLVLGLIAAAGLPDRTAGGVLVLVAAGVVATVAGRSGVGVVGAAATLVGWAGARLLAGPAYPGAWADLGLAALLLAVALAASLVRPPDARWSRWDVPLAVAAAPPALLALGVATSAEQPPVFVLVGGLMIGVAVRLAVVPRLRVAGEVLAAVGSVLVLTAAGWAGRGWLVGALLGLSAGHTALAALRESGAWRTTRQWLGAVLAAAAWLVVIDGQWLGAGGQVEADVTAVGGALVALAVLALVLAGGRDRSWALPWGSTGAALALMACLLPLLSDERSVASTATLTAGSAVRIGWWQVVAWVLLAVAAELAGRVAGSPAGWRLASVAPALAALVAGLSVAATTAPLRVTVLSTVSAVAALVVLLLRRVPALVGPKHPAEPPLVLAGVAALVLAAGYALAGDAGAVAAAPGLDVPRPVLVAAVLGVAAIEAAAYGIALRVLALRMAAPVLAWVAWVVYAADAVGGVVAWYTVPVGLAMLAVVEVWRADRRGRGRPSSDPAVAALDVAGIAFLVVASFVAAFTQSVVHALVAAGIGVAVFGWSLLTRVRRRLLAGATIVLAGLVVAVALPLVALVPAWGGAALWVLVAVVGLLVVLAATLLERGRAAVRDGRTRLVEATAGWE